MRLIGLFIFFLIFLISCYCLTLPHIAIHTFQSAKTKCKSCHVAVRNFSVISGINTLSDKNETFESFSTCQRECLSLPQNRNGKLLG